MDSSDVAAKLRFRVSSWSETINLKSETIFTVFVALFALAWYAWRTKGSKKGKLPLPPGPLGFPILGYLPFLNSELHHQFTNLAKTHGPIMKLWFGTKLCVVVSTPSLAKEILKDKDTIFANRDVPESARALYEGKGVTWSTYGSHWRALRKVFVREMMSNTCLEGYYVFRRREVHHMVTDVYGKIGNQINIGELAFITALNVISSILWGGTMSGEERGKVGAEFREVIDKIMELFGKPNVSEFFPSLAPLDLQGVVRNMKKMSVWLDHIFDSVIDQHMKMDSEEGDKEGNKDLLQFLLQLTKRGELTVTNIKAMFLDVVIGGTDTTSTSVEWAMTEIIRHPEIMKKVQEELKEVVGLNNLVEESHIPELPYLEAVLKEAQRLHPAGPFLVPQRPSESCAIGGYMIPKDTKVMVNVWAIHTDPEVWNNPLEFIPERFLGDSGKWDFRGHDFRYLPFGSGRRMCAGIPLAERMLMLILASLLHSFDWRLPEGTKLEVSDKFGLVLKKAIPLIAIPTPRLSKPELYL
ncbi:labd-13Z-ene-9,15,16-triol synthase, chloroplastic-like [Tasmannia lanceolata]|uniref:labd-13Z-ene-9,15,16-triol synthase, chloroplastic-like n=1 Tax=Tasmannia lanceolata TaxID=3420 RepID=UPI0040648289